MEKELQKDGKGRPIIIVRRDDDNLRYYMGSDAHGFIREDNFGEYIIIGNEKRYWRGIIEPLPDGPNFRELRKFGFVIVKPDAQLRRFCPRIVSILKEENFKIVAEKKVYFDRELIFRMYPYFFEPDWEHNLVEYLTSGCSSCLVVKGTDAINRLLEVRRQVRESYKRGNHRVINLIHCPDSAKEVVREVVLFFEAEEIVEAFRCKH